jgi:aryl-alcohol dehydrogenase-like predicted oxidoreductase
MQFISQPQDDRTSAQMALNWSIAQGNVIPIPGAKTASQAEQNAEAMGWTMEPGDFIALKHLSRLAEINIFIEICDLKLSIQHFECQSEIWIVIL